MNALREFDLTLFRFFNVELHRSWLDPLFWVVSSTGLGWVQALILGLVGLDFRRLPSGRWDWLWPVAWSGIFSGLSNNGLKRIFERDRPSQLDWSIPQETIFYKSFPSGHTAGAFGLAAAFLWLNPQLHWKWKALVVSWASLVGLSRIYRGVHWPTDVIGGAANGLLVAAIVVSVTLQLRARAEAEPD
ncbi:MAG: phosphatase PAP2 family protein [Fimbriimonadaceae bacterium]